VRPVADQPGRAFGTALVEEVAPRLLWQQVYDGRGTFVANPEQANDN
jgi:hypothetical protein